MPRLSKENLAALSALREEAPAACSWNKHTFDGCWEGCKVYADPVTEETVFLPLTVKRTTVAECNEEAERPLKFLGWGFRNVKGYSTFETVVKVFE